MTYRAGIIGTGGVAGLGTIGVNEAKQGEAPTASHAGGYQEAERIELVAAADIDRTHLDMFGIAWGIPEDRRYANHKTMLAEEDLDIVSICTPALYHHDHTIDCANAGVDVILCEKPIASSVTEAEEIIAACERTGAELIVNYTLRFTEKFQRLRELIDDGLLGDIRSVAVQSRMEVMRNASHVVDLLGWLLDAEPKRVSGFLTDENEAVEELGGGEVDDRGGVGVLEFSGQTFATVDCTVPREPSSISYQFVGSEGKLYLNLDDAEWRYWTLDDGHTERSVPGVDEAWTWASDYEQGFANAVTHAVALLDGTTDERICTGTDAVRSLEGLTALFVSAYTGSQVELPLARPLRDVEIRSW